ncbi:hypothetical protein RHSIM_Rhsim01G0050400 [Rhododendron simsii]|uniref:Fe2OG dioxygenase domain-containing protein n=1 Tax=Rhododendron simsii TaxID=118357 RepID=A0A834LW93_RHOSS|nr:hypothetical protein RHSIM_Rhsim01G0050400 [Rhododendron simsii]
MQISPPIGGDVLSLIPHHHPPEKQNQKSSDDRSALSSWGCFQLNTYQTAVLCKPISQNFLTLAMAESLSKPVQELIVSGGELPEKYIYKKGEHAATDVSYPPIEVPVIDLSLLASQSAAGEEELGKLRSALGSCGCFQAINHGMTASFLDQVHEIGKQFFALPIDEKQKYARTVGDLEGYGTDSVLSEHQTLDWTDRLYITVYPEDKIKLRFWPENPENFRGTPSKPQVVTTDQTKFLLKSMAKSLNIEEDCFLKQYGEGATMIARFNFYPPCPRPDLTLGVKPHADGSTITFLLQDKEVEGLQILQDGQWFRVPIVPHAILINVGDQAELTLLGSSVKYKMLSLSERPRTYHKNNGVATALIPWKINSDIIFHGMNLEEIFSSRDLSPLQEVDWTLPPRYNE